nr:uncharacterized protein LOC113722595 [Coffea arabica]
MVIPRLRIYLQALAIDDQAIPDHTYQQGIIKYKGRILIGATGTLRQQLISCMHESWIGGHSGNLGTYQRLKGYFIWPGMKREVEDFVQQCQTCKISKGEHCKYPGLLQPLDIPEQACNHYTAKGVAQVFFDNIYKLHGLPSSIVSDRGKVFGDVSTVLVLPTTQEMEEVPYCYRNNTNHHTALRMSPFQALYGYAPPQLSQRQYADRNRSERSFEVGDLVYLKLQPYKQTSIALRRNLKLSSKYDGPYRVLEKIGPVAYRLELPQGSTVHPVFHISLLKPSAKGAVVHSQPPTLTEESEVKITPAVVLARRTLQRNGRDVEQALIQW